MKRLIATVFLTLVLLPGIGNQKVLGQEGRQLQYGDTIQGTITGQDYRQVFYFQARRGDVVAVQMTPIGGNLDPLLLLADNAGNVLAMADDTAEGFSAAIATVEIPEDNYYFIVATRFGHSLGVTEGNFELALQRVGVLSVAGVFLNYGDSVVGLVDEQSPQVNYTFEARRGDIVNVRMQRISGNLDPYVYIMDENGQVLAANDDQGGLLDAAIEDFLILDPGTYTIVATRFGEAAGMTEGSFVLTLETAPTSGLGLSPEAALLLRYGDELRGSLDDEAYVRYYTFGAQRGDIVTISMTRASGSLDPLLVLLSSRQEVLAEDDDSGAGNNALIQSFIIPETGTYYVLATRFNRAEGETAGDYLIRLDGVTGEAPVVAPGTLTILYNSVVTGTIDDTSTAVTYAFLASAGDVITITMDHTSGDLDPLLLLFTTDGTQLASDDDSGPGKDARITAFTITEDGIYYIIATRYQFQDGETSGGYQLSLMRHTPDGADSGS